MKTKLKNFIADVQMPNLTDTHRGNSDPKHGILNGHGVPIKRSINTLGLKKSKI